jgi:hypothetical protein
MYIVLIKSPASPVRNPLRSLARSPVKILVRSLVRSAVKSPLGYYVRSLVRRSVRTVVGAHSLRELHKEPCYKLF